MMELASMKRGENCCVRYPFCPGESRDRQDVYKRQILTLVDTDTSLGAQVFRTGDLGVAQGDFSLMGENRLRLDYLPADCDLLGGDLVVTSGLGGFFPAGLVIGSVEELQMDDSGASSYAILAPAVDFSSLQQVVVIRSFDASN